jgi:3-oxoacyl-[acyl-carrier protein] reductase
LLQDASLQQLQDAFVQHIGSAHTIMQCVRGGMQAVKYGRFINIISTSVKQPLPNLGVSNTIRGAMASWAKTLANELGPDGITVNNVLPGATKTGRLEAIIQNQSQKKGVAPDLVEQHMLEEIPAGRFAGPEEIAAAVVFLASPAGGYVNGINVPVDGGRTKTL